MAAKSRNRNANQPQIQAQMVTTGSTLRMERPKSQRNQPKHNIPDIEVVGGFTQFLREHAVVALAIGFVIATQIQSLAKQLIASFIDPAFQLLGGQALSQRTFTLHFHDRAANFGWGAFVYGVLDVFFVLITIYAVVKLFKLENFENPTKKKAKTPDDDSL